MWRSPQPRLAVPLSHRCEGPAAWAGDGCAGGAGGEDAAVGDDDDVATAELLLELTHQALLDLVERLQQAVWDLQGTGGGEGVHKG